MATATTANGVRTFQIDKAHSEVTFQVRHLITKVRGRFSDFEGQVSFDAADPTRSSVTFTIQAASIDTNQADRDAHLRTGDFFKTDEFPTLTFTSERIASKGGDAYEVTGPLTIRGIAKPVTFLVDFLGVAKDPWGGERIAFEGEATINRKDFGVNWNAALETGGFLVGDEVKISLSVQAKAQ